MSLQGWLNGRGVLATRAKLLNMLATVPLQEKPSPPLLPQEVAHEGRRTFTVEPYPPPLLVHICKDEIFLAIEIAANVAQLHLTQEHLLLLHQLHHFLFLLASCCDPAHFTKNPNAFRSISIAFYRFFRRPRPLNTQNQVNDAACPRPSHARWALVAL